MFGGCDNVCDNAGLANSLIRISRVMKAIVERYNAGTIPNWEMCRDILSVFGEIFTRHMLRLYYNNNHCIITQDQMPDAIIPGYMYAEQFVLEANGVTSMNSDNYNKAKAGAKSAVNKLADFGNWLRDKLAKFLPSFFKTHFQKITEWFNAHGKEKYDLIVKAHSEGYNFPKFDKFNRYQVSFNPGKIDVNSIVSQYKDKGTLDDATKTEIRKKLMDAFNTPDIADELSKITEEKKLTEAITNAVLYSNINPTDAVQTDYQITDKDWEGMYKDLEFMCTKNQNGESVGGKWAQDIEKIATDLAKAVKDLTPVKTESFNIEIVSNIIQEEGNVAAGGAPAKPAESAEAPKTDGGDNSEQSQEQQQSQTQPDKNADLLDAIQTVSSSFLTISTNKIVTDLFPTIYGNFKKVLDDQSATTGKATDAKTQQTANATT
jgi:hypothetical protein